MPPRLDGIDVSKHQGKIDWGQVAGAHPGLRFVACRASHGGRNNGNLRVDAQARRNQVEMRKHYPKVPRGYYHHIGNSDPDVQAKHFCGVVGDLEPGEFVYLDVERDEPADVFNHEPVFIVEILEAIEAEFGVLPWLYIPQPGNYPKSDDARLHRFPLMLPIYDSESRFQHFAALMGRPVMVWQWGGDNNGATIAGITTGRVDSNIVLDDTLFRSTLTPGLDQGGSPMRGFMSGDGNPATDDTPLGFMRPLEHGAKGNSVWVLQSLLIEHGIFQDRPHNRDGEYEGGTRDGVARFQQQRGLPITGKVDRATWRKLARVN